MDVDVVLFFLCVCVWMNECMDGIMLACTHTHTHTWICISMHDLHLTLVLAQSFLRKNYLKGRSNWFTNISIAQREANKELVLYIKK